MTVDPARCCLYIPPGLRKFKLDLFTRVARHIERLGGTSTGDINDIAALSDSLIPIVGCQPESTPLIAAWRQLRRPWIYWDRGYARRVFATWLPRGEDGGYYRWHLNAFQMQRIRDVPDDRWRALRTAVQPWTKGGRHIVLAAPTATYARFHRIENWTEVTLDALSRVTDRQIVIRGKESKRPLQADLDGAHACISHGSIAAVEAAICGTPVFVHPDSAAALVGLTDLSRIESPVRPDREPWLRSLAYCQFNERELVDGTLWRLME